MKTKTNKLKVGDTCYSLLRTVRSGDFKNDSNIKGIIWLSPLMELEVLDIWKEKIVINTFNGFKLHKITLAKVKLPQGKIINLPFDYLIKEKPELQNF